MDVAGSSPIVLRADGRAVRRKVPLLLQGTELGDQDVARHAADRAAASQKTRHAAGHRLPLPAPGSSQQQGAVTGSLSRAGSSRLPVTAPPVTALATAALVGGTATDLHASRAAVTHGASQQQAANREMMITPGGVVVGLGGGGVTAREVTGLAHTVVVGRGGEVGGEKAAASRQDLPPVTAVLVPADIR